MSFENELFQRLIPIPEKLINYGFTKDDKGIYTYRRSFMNDDFYTIITIRNDEISAHVYDSFSDDEYTLIYLPQMGAYAAQVKEAYLKILNDFAEKCCQKALFISHQARRMAQIIKKIYHCDPVYPDPAKPYDAVFKDSKTFAIISLTDEQELLNVKVKETIYQQLLDKNGIEPTPLKRHRNWVAIVLNDTISDDILLELIRYSYDMTNKRQENKEWIIPSSADFDIDAYFASDMVLWRQTTNIQEGDIIYVYVAKPYSCILYKCVAVKVNLDSPELSDTKRKRKAMLMHPLERYDPHDYPLSLLKQFNVRAVRGPRFMPAELSHYINGDQSPS